MSYNAGAFSRFSYGTSLNRIIASLIQPRFSPPAGTVYNTAVSLVAAQTVAPTGGTVTNGISFRVDSPTGAVNNYGLLTTGSAPVGFGGTPTSTYFLIGATVSSIAITTLTQHALTYTAATNSNLIAFSEQTAFNPPAGTVYGTATGMQIAPTRGGAGTVTNLWNLVVKQPTGGPAGTISNVCADFQGITYHEAGVTFGAPGVGGYPGQNVDVLKFYVENTTWTPTVRGSTTAGTGTYTTQQGYYHRIGAMVFVDATIVWTAHTGTGNQQVAALPFTVRNQTNYSPMTSPNLISIVGPGGFAYGALTFVLNTTTGNLLSVANNAANSSIAMDTAGTVRYSGMYIT